MAYRITLSWAFHSDDEDEAQAVRESIEESMSHYDTSELEGSPEFELIASSCELIDIEHPESPEPGSYDYPDFE